MVDRIVTGLDYVSGCIIRRPVRVEASSFKHEILVSSNRANFCKGKVGFLVSPKGGSVPEDSATIAGWLGLLVSDLKGLDCPGPVSRGQAAIGVRPVKVIQNRKA